MSNKNEENFNPSKNRIVFDSKKRKVINNQSNEIKKNKPISDRDLIKYNNSFLRREKKNNDVINLNLECKKISGIDFDNKDLLYNYETNINKHNENVQMFISELKKEKEEKEKENEIKKKELKFGNVKQNLNLGNKNFEELVIKELDDDYKIQEFSNIYHQINDTLKKFKEDRKNRCDIEVFLDINLKDHFDEDYGLNIHVDQLVFLLKTYQLIINIGKTVIWNYKSNSLPYDKCIKQWDEFMDLIESQFKNKLEVLEKRDFFDHKIFNNKLAKLLKNPSQQFGVFFDTIKIDHDMDIECFITEQKFRARDLVSVYQFSHVSNYKEEPDSQITKKVEITERVLIKTDKDNHIEKLLTSIIHFFSFRTIITKMITQWLESQKFVQDDKTETKYDIFNKNTNLKYEILLCFTQLFNIVIRFILYPVEKKF
jgi:hypothetical protein